MVERTDQHVQGAKAQGAWKKLSEDLDALLEGKPVRNTIGIETAVQKWLQFREQHSSINCAFQ